MTQRAINPSIRVSGHLEEKRGIYQMALNWTDEDGQRGRRSISTGLKVKGNKKRAEEMLIEARREQERLLEIAPTASTVLFANYMLAWLEEMRADVKPTTFGSYSTNVKYAIEPYFRKKGTLLTELTAEDINAFYAEKLKTVKAMTVSKYHANISKALKTAVEKGLIEHSVMDRVKRPKVDRFVGKFLRQSEAVALFDAVKGTRLELGTILGAFYGLRRAEIVGLRWESIDFEANTITINHTVTVAHVDGRNQVFVGDTVKTKSSYRTLPLITPIREKLLAVQAEQHQQRKVCGNAYHRDALHYIYTDQLGRRIHPGYLSREFPRFLEKKGLRRIRFHDLRHSCASLLLASGVPLKQIQEWLGHSDFAITANTYAHLEYNSKLAAANAMTWVGQTSLAQQLGGGEEAETVHSDT